MCVSLIQGFLLHTKTTGPEATSQWQTTCPHKGTQVEKNPCKVGIPSRDKVLGDEAILIASSRSNAAAFESNCYMHSRVSNEWVPKLESALQSLV